MKIELNIDPLVIRQAQQVAQQQNQKLDELVESYLRNMVLYQQFKVSDDVKNLPKDLSNPEVANNANRTEKDTRYEYLAEKHLR